MGAVQRRTIGAVRRFSEADARAGERVDLPDGPGARLGSVSARDHAARSVRRRAVHRSRDGAALYDLLTRGHTKPRNHETTKPRKTRSHEATKPRSHEATKPRRANTSSGQ